MKLLIPYLLVFLGLCQNNRRIHLLVIILSIMSYLILVSQFPIGGDYKSLQQRADSIELGVLILNTDIIFQIIAQISKILSIDISVLYAVLILAFLPFDIHRPYCFLFVLILTYYFVITGFQRQALAALFFAKGIASTQYLSKTTFMLGSFFTHKSAVMLIAMGTIIKKPLSLAHTFVIGVLGFIITFVVVEISQGTFLHHYLQFYFLDQMLSSGVYFRFGAITLTYILLRYRSKLNRDLFLCFFEVLIVYSLLMIIYGATTAADRTLIFSFCILSYSSTIQNTTILRLQLASIPFFGMTVSWTLLSNQALANW